MKLLTIDTRQGDRAAVLLSNNRVLVLQEAEPHLIQQSELSNSLKDILAGNMLNLVKKVVDAAENASSDDLENLQESEALFELGEVTFRAPIPDPSLFICISAGYKKHIREMGSSPDEAIYPDSFLSAPSALAGHGCEIPIPASHPDMVDYEGELGVIIGKKCHEVSKDQALDYVAGYTNVNDVSARDWIPEFMQAKGSRPASVAWARNVLGKQYPKFKPVGPYLVTADEIDDPQALMLTTKVNGELRQSESTDDMIHSVAEIVSYFSQWYTLQPGDLISTGTPSGVGVGMKPSVFLKAGDQVDISIDGLGTLSNSVID